MTLFRKNTLILVGYFDTLNPIKSIAGRLKKLNCNILSFPAVPCTRNRSF